MNTLSWRFVGTPMVLRPKALRMASYCITRRARSGSTRAAIGDQVGEYFGHDESGGVTHNLRTVVVDVRGRVQKIFTDNKWTSEQLVTELRKAAAVKP